MREAYRRSDTWRAAGGPPAAPTPCPPPATRSASSGRCVYDGSALVLYALREEIGAAAFDRLERTWVRGPPRRYGDHPDSSRAGVDGSRGGT